jgi:membrane-bound lytic murein transglycosylase B
MLRLRLAVLFTALLLAIPSFAARCGGDFNTFLSSMSAEAASAGISQGVISQAFGGVSEDMAVLNFDRRQRYAALPSGID